MPIREKFVEELTPGIEPTPWPVWFENLSEDEQQRYHQARARMDAYRQEAIDSGLMIIDPATADYIWRDEQAKQQGKRQDDECLEFYNRYNTETGRKIKSVLMEVD